MPKLLMMMLMLLPVSVAAETTAPPSDHQQLVERYTAAFNARDVNAMAALMHPGIQWITISGDQSKVTTDGKERMVSEMESYFKSPTRISSSLGGWSVNGDYVTVIETASWSDSKGERQAQSATAVYQIADRLIRRVWYFPEQKTQ
ncbi:nuclear transport factor 2 family protein [Parasphingorhabdus cellanae]|uniref:Nuclear transport factor 2 family protein n=1 Tax=Parasphingorhabdus cellanae TaxID=2806553 RepID=A0ABX7T059_9SPHN|nr:nuclear transport factor 2 family protein [Parasphingorhabdus cellanae]QTD54919.1 nuclear transport factor 2 family protein [Parasphingorhabdus cellanae]